MKTYEKPTTEVVDTTPYDRLALNVNPSKTASVQWGRRKDPSATTDDGGNGFGSALWSDME